MKLTLTHSFPHPVAAVWAMLVDPGSHVAKFEGMGHRDLAVVSSTVAEDAIDLEIRRTVEMEVPSIAAKFLKPTNTVTSDDHWVRTSDERLDGHYTVDIKGVPAETKGVTSVVADGPKACTYTIELEVKVKVPLIGEKVAGAIKPQLEAQIAEEFAACDAWLASH